MLPTIPLCTLTLRCSPQETLINGRDVKEWLDLMLQAKWRPIFKINSTSLLPENVGLGLIIKLCTSSTFFWICFKWSWVDNLKFFGLLTN